jgi:hypothetical protein
VDDQSGVKMKIPPGKTPRALGQRH